MKNAEAIAPCPSPEQTCSQYSARLDGLDVLPELGAGLEGDAAGESDAGAEKYFLLFVLR